MSVFKKVVFFVSTMSASSLALAEPVLLDFTTLTGDIDVSTIVGAIMAVAGVMVGVHLALKGAQLVMRAIKGS